MKPTRREILKITGMSALAAGLAQVTSLGADAFAGSPVVPPLEKFDREDELLAAMTIEEKVGQLTQFAGDFDSCRVKDEHRPLIRAGLIGSLYFVKGAAASNEAQRIAVEESRLKIPLIIGFDVIHGYRTVFPIPLAESCSWDLALMEKSARLAAREARAAGVHWTFAPMVDIARDPRWGRIAEGGGEDQVLGARIAAARVRGFQGRGLGDPEAVAACVKHFAGYGAAEGGRDYNTTEISERTLREVYLPPFRAAVNAGSASVMSSFNDMNGLPSSANRFLLQSVLRGEWKFTGVLLSDYDAIGELVKHGIAENLAAGASESITIGLDMDMESGAYQKNLAALVREGKVPVATLDASVRRVLRLKNKLGLFTDPYANTERERLVLQSDEIVEHARVIARRSIVLLKNAANVLPLGQSAGAIAVIGPLADDKKEPLGCWSADGKPENVVTVLEGLRLQAASGVQLRYAKGCEIEGAETGGIAAAVALARASDVVVAVMGESAKMSGEAASRAFLDLPGVQGQLLRELHATGKPVVLVLMSGRPLAIQWENDNLAAIVAAWHLGVQSGNAIADVLFGAHNPTGRLTTSVPRAVGQIPVNYNHKNTGRPTQSKYLDLPQTPLYPFGFGLSYSTFKYADLRLQQTRFAPNESLVATVEVQNTGTRPGTETVQLYIRDLLASVTRPVRELKAWNQVTLAPGEKQRVRLEVDAQTLGYYDRQMRYVIEAGKFKVWVGPNSAEGLEADFELY